MNSSPSDLFARFGDRAKPKLVVLGALSSLPVSVTRQVSSLNTIEHVSPFRLMRPEISRQPPPRSPRGEDTVVASMRRWFWSRKPDAGFLLTDFPATLLQALMFDEWLDARNEALDGVLLAHPLADSLKPVFEHYRTLGLTYEAADFTLNA